MKNNQITIVIKGGMAYQAFANCPVNIQILDLDQTDDADKRDADEILIEKLEKDGFEVGFSS